MMRKKVNEKEVNSIEEKKEEFEFFNNGIPHWTIDTLKRKDKPSSFNQMVNVKRYKLTIELIEESKEIVLERCLKLYKEEDNWHNKDTLNVFVEKITGKRIQEILEERNKLSNKNDGL